MSHDPLVAASGSPAPAGEGDDQEGPASPPGPPDPTGETVYETACRVLDLLERIRDQAAQVDEPQSLGHTLLVLRDITEARRCAYEAVEVQFLALMGEKQVDIPGAGTFEAKPETRRTEWQHTRLRLAVASRIADDASLFIDVETGERHPPAETVRRVLKAFLAAASPSWKVTGLRAIGVKPGDYCTEERGRYKVMLPSKPKEEGEND